MKQVGALFLVAFAFTLLLAGVVRPALAVVTLNDSIDIHSDGSVTPLDAPVARIGDTYVFNNSVVMSHDYYDGVIIERDNIVLDGAGYKLQGLGGSDGVHMEERVNVTVKNFLFESFYYGVASWNCSQCTISGNNLTADMYSLYLQNSSGNRFYHNNIMTDVYFENSNNSWDSGYPSGGNYWNGYPYSDANSGPNQNQPGSDGIGDTPIDLSLWVQYTNDVDHYPLMTSAVIPEAHSIVLLLSVLTATLLLVMAFTKKSERFKTYPYREITNADTNI